MLFWLVEYLTHADVTQLEVFIEDDFNSDIEGTISLNLSWIEETVHCIFDGIVNILEVLSTIFHIDVGNIRHRS